MIKQAVYDEVLSLAPFCQKVARWLWQHPEVGGSEQESADYLRKILKKEGFRVIDSQSMAHAFYAEYGEGYPVVAVLGEYDALPGLSQKACPDKVPVTEGGPGHGCGHNLLGSASLTAAIAIKRFLAQTGMSGTIRFYGCPQEELLDGKVKMIGEGLFDGCDVALTWHPMDVSMAFDAAYLANTSLKFYFSGLTSHAAFAPEQGRSALDAVELMNVGCNYLREHVVDRTRIHYTTDSGGFAPNIVPNRASAWYYVRAPRMVNVDDTVARLEKIAQGAALMTETEVSIQHGCACYEFQENNAFADLTYANLIEADGPKYTEEELAFAQSLQENIKPEIVAGSRKAYGVENEPVHMGVGARELWRSVPLLSSSDTGDVSYRMPANLFSAACWPLGCAPHTWQATAASGTTIGEKGALYAAKVIAGTAWDLFTKPEVLKRIVREFNDRSDGSYTPHLGD